MLRTHTKGYAKLFLACVLRSAFWIGMMLWFKLYSNIDISGKDDLWMAFFSIVAVIYAITIAFLLVVVLERFNTLSTSVMEEINIIQNIRDFLIYVQVQPEIQKKVYKGLIDYAKYVKNVEWHVMTKNAKKNKVYDSDTSEELYDVINAVSELEPRSCGGNAAVNEIIKNIANITTIRTKRIEMNQRALSPLLYFYLQFMGALLVIPFMLFEGGSLFIQGAMIFGVVTAIRVLYEIVRDFDQPLVGFWNINTAPLGMFIEKEMNSELNNMLFEKHVLED